MSFDISLPYHTVSLRFATGGELTTPILNSSVLRMDQSGTPLARKFAKAFQEKVLNQGTYIDLLDYRLPAAVEAGKISVPFPASKGKAIHPAFEITFDYIFWSAEKQLWAVVPALGVEAVCNKEEDLEKSVVQSIRLEFLRNERKASIAKIISALWYESFELKAHKINFQFFTPGEQKKRAENNRKLLLPSVAKRIDVVNKKLYGREAEMKQLSRIVKGKYARNVILVGPSGVGKTAMVWELARQRNKYKLKAEIWETTASTMIKELTTDTGWEDNLAFFAKELTAKGDFLFVRNLTELFEVGRYEGNSVSMAEYLREYIARGEVNLISECTEEEYARIEMQSPSFLPLFQIIRLEEPREGLEDIITHSVKAFAENLEVSIDLDAILETIRLNRRFTPYSGFPGKPIRFLESVILHGRVLQQQNQKDGGLSPLKINRSEVIRHFCEETGMPAFIVDPAVPMNLAEISQFFHSNIFGQQVAVDSVVDLLASVKTALTRSGKPIASFLFVGPTGVGKTEMAKVLAQFMFGSRDRMIRFDMSEYSNPYSVMRLTGEHFFQDGILTSAVRKEPFSVVLFDEIEKAHPVFYDLLLQLLSEGRLTNSSGKLVNFCSTIIIMTSNIGAGNLQSEKISWKNTIDTVEINEHFMSAVKNHFRPELYNRIDKVIPFEPLTKEVVQHVVKREIRLLKKTEGILYRKMDFYLKDNLLDWLAEKGYDPKYGARQLQRTIRDKLVIPLSIELNSYNYDDHLVVNIDCDGQQPLIHIESDPLKIDLLLEELERNEWAEYAAELRRSIHRIMEGSVYIRLLSELDILEGKIQRLKDRFWQKPELANRYTSLLDMQDRTEQSAGIIEAYEQEFALTCMGMLPYQTRIIDRIKKWETDYLNLKMKLYSCLNASFSTASLLIVGDGSERVFNLLLKILGKKKFEFSAKTLWYNETYFNELIEVEGESKKVPRLAYFPKKYIPGSEKNFLPKQEGDKFIGIQVNVKGDGAYLYLESERGLHRWKVNDKKMLRIVVAVTPKEEKAPTNLHRKNFFDNRVSRRTIEPNYLTDTDYNIKREIPKGNHEVFLLEVMNKNFGLQLDAALL